MKLNYRMWISKYEVTETFIPEECTSLSLDSYTCKIQYCQLMTKKHTYWFEGLGGGNKGSGYSGYTPYTLT